MTATPILYVKEPRTMKERIQGAVVFFVIGLVLFTVVFPVLWAFQAFGSFSLANAIGIIVVTLIGFFIPSGRNFYLCEEGVSFPGRGGRFYPWASFSKFTIDDGKKIFKLKTSRGSIQLSTMKHFDEAKEILLKYIVPKQ